MQDLCKIINSYDKIQDNVFWFDKQWVMKFVVKLNKYDESGKQENYHKEFGYNSKHGPLMMISREFTYNFVIENVKDRDQFGFKYNVRIYEQDMFLLLYTLNRVENWFVGDSRVFRMKDHRVIIPAKGSVRETIQLVTNKNGIEIEPTVLNIEGVQTIGATFYFGAPAMCAFMPMSRVLQFIYIMRNFNMFQSAQNMVLYINTNRPGRNCINMQNNYTPQGNTKGFFESTGAIKE